MNKFSFFFISFLFCAVNLVGCNSSTNRIKAQNNNVNPVWSKWIQQNAKPIEATNLKNFQDLQFLKPILQDKKIVLLGESSHGVKEYDQLKVRLVEFLHQQMGFDVIAFESPLGGCTINYLNISNQSPDDSLKNSLFQIWNTQELLPLFQYMKQEQTSLNPLILSGFDMQPEQVQNIGFLDDWFSTINKTFGEQVNELEQEFMNYYLRLNSGILDPYKDRIASLTQGYNALLEFLKQNKTQLQRTYPNHPELVKVTEHMFQERLKTIELIKQFNTKEDFTFQIQKLRDAMMADNINWITNELYPGKKVIVWAHDGHIEKNGSIAKPIWPYKRMGELLPDTLKQKSYTLGLYMNQGKVANVSQQIYDLPKSYPSDSIESVMNETGYEVSFINLKGQVEKNGNSWMFKMMKSYIGEFDPGQLAEEDFIPIQQYDGILYVNHVHPPDYK